MSSLCVATWRIPADLHTVLPAAAQKCPTASPEGHGSRDRDGVRPGALGGCPEGVCGYLEGEERRIAYRMTDWRFSWELKIAFVDTRYLDRLPMTNWRFSWEGGE